MFTLICVCSRIFKEREDSPSGNQGCDLHAEDLRIARPDLLTDVFGFQKSLDVFFLQDTRILLDDILVRSQQKLDIRQITLKRSVGVVIHLGPEYIRHGQQGQHRLRELPVYRDRTSLNTRGRLRNLQRGALHACSAC